MSGTVRVISDNSLRILQCDSMEEREFISGLKSVWMQYKKSEPLITRLKDCFSTDGCNPFLRCLYIIFNSSDYISTRPCTFCSAVFEVFDEWWKSEYNGSETESTQWLTDEVKYIAFKVLIGFKNSSVQSMGSKIFKLSNQGYSFKPILDEMLRDRQFKEVCQWSLLLGLERDYGMMEFLIPLYVLDKVQMVDEFIAASPRHLKLFLTFLDSLLSLDDNPKARIEKILIEAGLDDMVDIIIEKVYLQKAITKYIKRLLQKHPHLESSIDLVNYRQRCIRSKLSFLIRARYIDGSMSDETMQTILMELMTSEDDNSLKEELIFKLVEVGDLKEALLWADKLSADPSSELKAIINGIRYEVNQVQSSCGVSKNAAKDWDADLKPIELDYYTLSIPESSINLVESKDQFAIAIQQAMHSSLIGIDCEWSPLVSCSSSRVLSLFQMATPDAVYILDAQKLKGCQQLWMALTKDIINNPSIIKIGFSLFNDMRMVAHLLDMDTVKSSSIFDLKIVADLLANGTLDIPLPYYSEEFKQKNSLTQMVYNCFGQKLKKAEQFSDWNSRPLRIGQIMYAALDAFCLIEIFKKLQDICENASISFDGIIDRVMEHYQTPSKKKMAKKKRKKKRQESDCGIHVKDGRDSKTTDEVASGCSSSEFCPNCGCVNWKTSDVVSDYSSAICFPAGFEDVCDDFEYGNDDCDFDYVGCQATTSIVHEDKRVQQTCQTCGYSY